MVSLILQPGLRPGWPLSAVSSGPRSDKAKMCGGRKSQAPWSVDQVWKALAFDTLSHLPKVVCG